MFNLKDLFLFQGIADEKVDKMIKALSSPVSYRKHDIIYDTDRFDRALGVFLSGVGCAENEGSVFLKRNFTEGSVFGAAAVFGEMSGYVSRIRARSDCIVCFIPQDVLEKWFKQYPKTVVNYVSFLSERIRFLNNKLSQMTDKSVSARLYRYISDSADENGVLTVKNMAELARMTRMGRTSLYRALSELEEKGFILREHDLIILM